ncbi:hypothetical protein V8E53_008060 [Lactarius tabidus]
MSVQAMEQVLGRSSDPDNLELNDVPPEVWAALRTAVPARGSTLSESISCLTSFAEARDNNRSGASSPMDNSLTTANIPLFLPGSSNEGQLSTSYHPQSLEVEDQLPHNVSPPPYQMTPDIYNTTFSLRSLTSTSIGINPITVITSENDCYFEAIGLMDTITDELNQAAEGHSHYFLKELLTILRDPAFPVQSEELCRILDLTAAALSVGPRLNNTDDIWCLLRPSDWYRAATHTMAAILRGCICTKDIRGIGNFPLQPLRDTYRRLSKLPTVETQWDLLEAMALQVAEQLSLNNGPYLPQDSVDSIQATVWHAHKAQIRMVVTMKANEVKNCLTTMGLSELIDNLLNEATEAEITNMIREDIALQTRSKYNNKKLETENNTYHEMINQVIADGKTRAAKEVLETYANISKKLCEQKERQVKDNTDKYYSNLLEKAKEQACLKADSKFTRLLADEQSAIAPRVDAEIALEHKKLIAERHLATEAQLKALTMEEEKALVCTAASHLRMSIQVDEHTSKKVKVDQHKACPAPVTPRGRSNSSVSLASSQATSRKWAYSPLEVIVQGLPPDRDKQKMPTPPKEVTTVTFQIKAEPTPQPSFATPSMPSVMREAINIAKDVSLPPDTPLHRTASSIHNKANHMTIDPEHLNLANIFLPGIPQPPINVLLPPAMSRTPKFGGAEAHKDGTAPSCLPEVSVTDTFETQMLSLMAKFNQPIWDTIHRIEQALGEDRIPRILQRAGPGYWSEHIVNLVPRDTLVAPPFPSEPPVPEWSIPTAESFARVDDEEFPALETSNRGARCKHNNAQAVICQQSKVLGATGPDNGHIPLTNNNSRIKPLFANVRAVQGHKQSGNQGPRKSPADRNMTEVTVIRFGGLENKEEECKFRACNPIKIIQSV